MEELRTGKMTIAYEVGNDTQIAQIELEEGSTWKKPLRTFIEFLNGMGYSLPDELDEIAYSIDM